MPKTKILNLLSFYVMAITIIVLVLDLGFNKNLFIKEILYWFYHISLGIAFLSVFIRYFSKEYKPKISVRVFDIFLLLLILVDVMVNNFFFVKPTANVVHPLFYTTFFVLFIRELSDLNIIFKRSYLNPAQLFIMSFLMLIFLGTGLLMLPRATHTQVFLFWMPCLPVQVQYVLRD